MMKLNNETMRNDVWATLENCLAYAKISNDSTEMVSMERCADAFVQGYKAALICGRVYTKAVFLTGRALDSHVWSRVVSPAPNSSQIITMGSEWESFYYQCKRYFTTEPEALIEEPEVKQAFICGFQFAYHDTEKFDDCLLLAGHQLESYVFAKIISCQKKQENASRAQARILVNSRYSPRKATKATNAKLDVEEDIAYLTGEIND